MKITELQLQQLKDLNNSKVNDILGLRLQIGKWYKGHTDFKSLICVTEIKKEYNYNVVSYYGFFDGRFENSAFVNTNHEKSLTPATHEEVETALIEEAKKRGFKKGCWIKNKPLGFGFDETYNDNNTITWDGTYLNIGKDKLAIFCNGKWAEVFSNPIKEQIAKLEQELNELKKLL